MAALAGACGGSAGRPGQETGVVRVSNWDAYLDDATPELFRRATGIRLDYRADYLDNETYFQEFRARNDGNVKAADRDIVVPTYWMAARLIRLHYIQALPLARIPNSANLRTELRRPAWDPDGRYTLPYVSGMTGIAYNRNLVGRDLKSVNDLFAPDLKGKVTVLSEMRETLGLMLLADGQDPAKATFDTSQRAFERLEAAKASGHLLGVLGNEYLDGLEAGRIAACMAWSGDVIQLATSHPELHFVIPEEGGMWFTDTMVIPRWASHLEEAAAFMNYYYDPVNAARITSVIRYLSPVQGVREELVRLGGESAKLADNTLVFPDNATAARLHNFADLTITEAERFDARFATLTGGD